MKKIVLLGALFTLMVNAEITEKCTGCHGENFGTSALGKSGIVKDMTKDEIIKSINGYKKGTINKYGLGALMKSQVAGLSDKEVQEIADKIVNRKKVKAKTVKDKNSIDTPIKKEIAKCAGKEGDASRLICYDDLAKSIGVDKPKVITKSKGKWVVSESKSPIDDSITVTMMLDASDTIINPYGQFTRPTLILRCSENKTNAFISWDMFLGTNNIRVLNRIDKQKAKTRSWYISTDNKAIFAPKNIAFIKSLFGHEKLLQQLTPYGESPKTTSFEIGGLKEAIKPLRKACGW